MGSIDFSVQNVLFVSCLSPAPGRRECVYIVTCIYFQTIGPDWACDSDTVMNIVTVMSVTEHCCQYCQHCHVTNAVHGNVGETLDTKTTFKLCLQFHAISCTYFCLYPTRDGSCLFMSRLIISCHVQTDLVCSVFMSIQIISLCPD